jgi:TonB family protein
MASSSYEAALGIEPDNVTALEGMARLSYVRSAGSVREADKLLFINQAARYWQRVIDLRPDHAEAHYSFGVMQWASAYPAFQRARNGNTAATPIADPAVRASLRAEYGQSIESGIGHMRRALEIRPGFDEAMAYINLLYRLRADLSDTSEEYAANISTADDWVQKALATKRQSAGTMIPPPPPPPPGVRQIRVGGNIQALKLIAQPAPVYPDMARQARIQGVVRYNAVIGRDGRIVNLTLVSGHPLLVPAATDAVRQWLYQPTLLNGEPVEVVTQIDVNFTLSP